jgi:pyruvate/2-oxoglutarate dehydrogenase complex dihydrolipoamide dehydrogenase (E3) component
MDYDFLIIGGGSAGYAAARTAHTLGLKTVVIEGGREIGGLCILRGCMPSKTLIESANRNLTLRRASEFGLRASGLEVHGDEIIARKRRLIGEFADFRRGQLESGGFEFIRGRASFIDQHTVRVALCDGGEKTWSFRAALIATGSVVNTPSFPGLADAGYLTSDDLLDLAELPTSVAILGAGPVALESAHYLAALGSEVTLVQRSGQILTGSDCDVATALEKALRERGVKIYTKTDLQRFETVGGKKRVVFRRNGKEHAVEAQEILNALGRHANLDGLNLEAAGVAVVRGAIPSNARQQTTSSHIFAAGDAAGPLEIVHIAVEQGEIAARNAARLLDGSGEPLDCIDYRLKLFVVFTEPQVAIVGSSEEELQRDGIPFRASKYPFDDHGKSLIMGETEGFVKLLAHAESGEILGGACVGPHAGDLIHEIVVAMAFRATVAQLASVPHYHPTLSEIWTYPAAELAGS